jgi:hypothetical protein
MTRAVPISQSQIEEVERIAFDLIRGGEDHDASRLLGIALAWKVSPIVRGGTTDDASPLLTLVSTPADLESSTPAHSVRVQ